MSPARPDTAPAVRPIEVSAELKALMRRLKLGQLIDTLPERLALARTNRLPHHDFLELLFADEVTRRDRESAARRAKAAHLDPAMQLQAWDDSAAVAFDQQLWAELTSLRFLADAYNVLVMGPVGVGKTFLANALGHIAVRRHHSVHTERADKLFKRLGFLLQVLSIYCNDSDRGFFWPPDSLLGQIDQCVALLIELEGKKPRWVGWKTFERLDKRRRSLRLVPRIDSLVKRAIQTREERCGESVLEKAARGRDSLKTQILLRDFVEQKTKFVNLLNDHDNRTMERVESWPLVDWLCSIDHPDAHNLILPGLEPVGVVGLVARFLRTQKVSRKRLKNRERQDRYRQRKNSLLE